MSPEQDLVPPKTEATTFMNQILDAGVVSESDLARYRERGGSIEMLLNDFVTEGYLLHGSGVKVSVLEPFAGDDDRDEEKRATGVYATSLPAIALFKATVSQTELQSQFTSVTSGWGTAHENGQLIAKLYATESIDNACRNGFVYVLSRDSFTKIDEGEYIASAPVTPVVCVPVESIDLSTPVNTHL